MSNYVKVRKNVAREMYYQGMYINILPSKVPMNNKFISPAIVNFFDNHTDFEVLVNAFMYYNCNKELGYYPHYYVKSEDYDKYKMCSLMCD